MDEYVAAVKRFAEDMCAVGTPRADVIEAARLYTGALLKPSDDAWARLYRHVSHTLAQRFGQPLDPAAARRLLAFVDDDFGRALPLPHRVAFVAGSR
jgi:hypothetical protein